MKCLQMEMFCMQQQYPPVSSYSDGNAHPDQSSLQWGPLWVSPAQSSGHRGRGDGEGRGQNSEGCSPHYSFNTLHGDYTL